MTSSIFSPPNSDKDESVSAWRQTQSSLCEGESPTDAIQFAFFSIIKMLFLLFMSIRIAQREKIDMSETDSQQLASFPSSGLIKW